MTTIYNNKVYVMATSIKLKIRGYYKAFIRDLLYLNLISLRNLSFDILFPHQIIISELVVKGYTTQP